jgi:hypothetical protein
MWFPPNAGLVVSERLREQCATLKGIRFRPVVFDRLVDVAMPPLGDPGPDPGSVYSLVDEWFEQLPDVKEFHDTIGRFYHVLVPDWYELPGRRTHAELMASKDEEKSISIDFGTYFGRSRPDFPVIPRLLREYDIYSAGMTLCMTAAAFRVLCEHINPDYFLVSYRSLRRKERRRDQPAEGFDIVEWWQ